MTLFKLEAKPGMALPTVLLTGFDAFGGDSVNPSWLVAQALDGQTIVGHRVVAAQLPTEFSASTLQLALLLSQHKPALVLCLGLAGSRACLSIERIAINVQDARIADNAGAQPIDVPVVPGGPAAYFSTLPVKAMQQAMLQQGVATEISQTAGTFVCNHVFYALMHHLQSAQRGGFIHVPYLPHQGQPHMTLDDMVRGIRAACACALTTRHDIAYGAGTLS